MFGGGGSSKERDRDNDYMDEGPGGRRRPPQMREREPPARRERSSSKGTGFMGMMLPVYCIGIVLYLVYTLMKVYGKNDKEKEKKSKRAQRANEFSDGLEAMATMGKRMPGVVGPGKFDAAALSGHPRTALIEQPLEAHLQPKPGSASSSGSGSPGARHTHASGEECEGELSRAELLTASADPANVVNHSDFTRLQEAEIDSLRRRLEETEKLMARMLLQMNAAAQATASAAPATTSQSPKEEKSAESAKEEEKTAPVTAEEKAGVADENANESSAKEGPEEESGLRQRKPVTAKDTQEGGAGPNAEQPAPAEAKAETAPEKKADKPEKSE